MRRIVALGATSGIMIEVLKNFASANDSLFLVGRDFEKLKRLEQDLEVRGASAAYPLALDLADASAPSQVMEKALKHLQSVDLLIVGYGVLTDQSEAEHNTSYAVTQLNINFTTIVEHCLRWASYFETQGKGHIVVIGSVAGDRGRKSNYIYGAAKAGLDAFLSGLRNRLYKKGVFVTTVKPGFVDTPMTKHLKKGLLFASASSVGASIYQKVLSRADIVYVPWFWRFIMIVIKMIPEKIFKKLSI